MCAQKLKLFSLLLAFCFASLSAFSQDGGQPEASPESLLSEAPQLPEPQNPQIAPSMTREQRQAESLKSWIAWYQEVKTYQKAVESWSNRVSDSWTKAKSSYEKLIAAQDLAIKSRDVQIATLKEELVSARKGWLVAGGAGFAAGFAAGRYSR